MRLLTDADIEELATRDLVVSSMRAALVAAYRIELVSPPRASGNFDGRRLTFIYGDSPSG